MMSTESKTQSRWFDQTNKIVSLMTSIIAMLISLAVAIYTYNFNKKTLGATNSSLAIAEENKRIAKLNFFRDLTSAFQSNDQKVRAAALLIAEEADPDLARAIAPIFLQSDQSKVVRFVSGR